MGNSVYVQVLREPTERNTKPLTAMCATVCYSMLYVYCYITSSSRGSCPLIRFRTHPLPRTGQHPAHAERQTRSDRLWPGEGLDTKL